MLLEFKVCNFLSIDDMQVLRMRRKDKEGTESGSDFAFIYGANSSGKSNLIAAMDFSRNIILGHKTKNYKPHLDLNNEYTDYSPSYFEYVFELDGLRYSYGFEVDLREREKASNIQNKYERSKNLKSSIKSEWLYIVEPDGNYKIFDTSVDKREKNSNSNGVVLGRIKPELDETVKKKLGKRTDVQNDVYRMFKNNFIIRMSETDEEFTPVPKGIVRFLSDNLRRFDTGITGVAVIPFTNTEIPKNLIKHFEHEMTWDDQLVYIRGNSKKRHWLIYIERDIKGDTYYELRFKHNSDVYARIEEESIGTRKLIQLLTLIASQMTMNNKGVIVIDEIECSIHVLAIEEFVKMFKSPSMKGAQLIFTTHQHRLLSEDCSKPEDIWFMDCVVDGDNKYSKLYALKSFNSEMVDYDEKYYGGRYSAIPIFTSYKLESDE